MSAERKLNRRDFLKASALTVLGSALAACAQPAAPTAKPAAATAAPTKPAAAATAAPTKPAAAAEPTKPAAAPTKFAEAPMLADQVKAGKLPAVEQRLPSEPLVVQPNKSIGKYGGTWKMGSLGYEGAFVTRTMGYEQLLRWDVAFTKQIPNLAKSWQVNSAGNEFTFNLRKGLKWSDGSPMTADDWVFKMVDVFGNAELTPKFPPSLAPLNEKVTFSKVDDFTIKFTFAKPYGTFIVDTASPDPGVNWGEPVPSAYMKQFHTKYADKAKLDQMVTEAKFKNWWELYAAKNNSYQTNPEKPVHYAWVMQPPPFGTAPEATLQRNPYYWKVDPQGQQLPYIDKVTFKSHQSKDTILLDAMAGQIDMQYRSIEKLENYALLKQNAEKGGFHFFKLVPGKMNTLILWPNYCHKDPVMKKIYLDPNFRIGLSYGVDRQEIINVVYAGQGEPWQPAPLRGTPFFNEKMAKRYTEYDVKKANETLDKVLPNKDKDGFRLRPDNQKLSIIVETPSDFNTLWIDILQLYQNHWKKIGIDLQIKTEARELYTSRSSAGECDMVVWEGDIGVYGVMNIPTGTCGATCVWPCWLDWVSSGGKSGEEPEPTAKKLLELWNELLVTVDPDKQRQLVTQMQDQEPLYGIGTSTMPNYYGVVKNNFNNVPDEFPDLWIYPTPAPTNTCQYWIG